MGDYTPTQKLYKVDSNELVSAEQNLNYNWRRLDGSVKGLLGWNPTDLTNIAGTALAQKGYKILKRRSNATLMIDSTGTPKQDLNAFVNSWTLIPESSFVSGWGKHSDPTFGRPMYYLDADGDVYLRGTFQKTDASEIPVKTTITIAVLPVTIQPTSPRYLFQHGGLADSLGYSVNRFYISTTGDLQIVRYGNTQGNPLERYVTLSGLYYPKDVGA